MSEVVEIDVLKRNARQLERAIRRADWAMRFWFALGVGSFAISFVAIMLALVWYDVSFWRTVTVSGPGCFVIMLLRERCRTLFELQQMYVKTLAQTLIALEQALRRVKETAP